MSTLAAAAGTTPSPRVETTTVGVRDTVLRALREHPDAADLADLADAIDARPALPVTLTDGDPGPCTLCPDLRPAEVTVTVTVAAATIGATVTAAHPASLDVCGQCVRAALAELTRGPDRTRPRLAVARRTLGDRS